MNQTWWIHEMTQRYFLSESTLPLRASSAVELLFGGVQKIACIIRWPHGETSRMDGTDN